MRKWEVFSALLLVLSSLLYLLMLVQHPVIEVGIVLSDDLDRETGLLIDEGFDVYGEYLDSRLLDHRFNSTNVSSDGTFLLNSDFFGQCPIDKIREDEDVDVVLIVTSEMIRNWDGNGKALWGEAENEKGAALITIHYWASPTKENVTRWRHIAVHEVFHLLGYVHNRWDRSGVMQYAGNVDTTELCPYYEFQLPIRTVFYHPFEGLSFRMTVFLMNMAVVFLLMPAVLLEEMVVRRFDERYLSRKKVPLWLSGLVLLGGAAVLFSIIGSFMVFPVILLFSLVLHLVHYFLKTGKRERKASEE
ncbi:MAG: hypothetical protein ACMUHU_04595 [Thermoplasmatota archaeon]